MSAAPFATYTPEQLAEALQLSPKTVRAMVSRKDIQPAIVAGRRIRIPTTARIRSGRDFVALEALTRAP